MQGLSERPPGAESESNWRPVVLGVGLVVVVVAIVAVMMRSEPKVAKTPPPYAANIKISDLKLSAAENFVGASVSYLDGTVVNSGDKTVTHVVLNVVFKDSLGQVAQSEDVPLHVLQTTGPYPDAIDLSASPLAPGQSKQFRLTFEHISAEWNQEYPVIQVTDVRVK